MTYFGCGRPAALTCCAS